MKKWIAVAATLVVLGALTFAGYRIYLNEAHDNAVKLVPPNALLYGNVFLNPSTHQKQALRDLLEKFPAAGDPEDTKTTLERYFDDALAGAGIDYTHDVEPWLGREVAAALLPPLPAGDSDAAPNALVFVGTKDDDESMKAVEAVAEHSGAATTPGSYRDVDYEIFENEQGVAGIVGDFLVIASNETSFRDAVDASEGASLATTSAYKKAIARLPKDRIALSYVSAPGFLSELKRSGEVPADVEQSLPSLARLKPIAAAAFLRSDGVVVDVALETGRPDGNTDDVVGMAPESSWGALGVHDLGPTVAKQLELIAGPGLFGGLAPAALSARVKALTGLDLDDDILSWMGDATTFVGGGDSLRGGAVVESDDSKASASAVYRLGRELAAHGIAAGVGDHDATHATVGLTDPSLPILMQLIAQPGEVWFVLGGRTAEDVDSPRLSESRPFRDAKAAFGDFSMVGYLNADGLREFAESTYEHANGALPSDYVRRIAPNLDPLSFVGLGTRTVDGVTSYRLMIGVE